jgi:hypothetical protein
MSMARIDIPRVRIPGVIVLLFATSTPLARAQGVGATGLEVAQVPAGARAGALAGAYTGLWGDADVVFANPSALAGLGTAASLSYQRHVMDISFGSLAGATRIGPVSVGAGIAFMDGGEVPEIVPDDRFGGQRGRPSGATVSARETTFRLAAGLPLRNERFHVGAAAGFALSELAGVSRSAPFLDLGAQARISARSLAGLALRNLGGALSGAEAIDADLPLEARLGASYLFPLPEDLALLLTADVVRRIREESTGLAAGVEFGLLPVDQGIGGVVRLGQRVEADLPARNALQLGAGVSYAGIWLDYHYQDLEFFGTAHRIGIRWRR